MIAVTEENRNTDRHTNKHTNRRMKKHHRSNGGRTTTEGEEDWGMSKNIERGTRMLAY